MKIPFIKPSTKDYGNYKVVNCEVTGNKAIDSDDFHLRFRRSDGLTLKWGKTPKDDPTHCPFGPEIADVEITKACRGIRDTAGNRSVCAHCYKSNKPEGSYMSLETFKTVFHHLTKAQTLTQIAFGVDAEASEDLNPDIWKIFAYCKENGITPNVTVADITPYTAEKIVEYCGAVAVSFYPTIDKNRCYDAVELLGTVAESRGKDMKVNIHALLAQETLPYFDELIEDIANDDRLSKLNAVVMLSLKQKGRGVHFNRVTEDEFEVLIDKMIKNNVSYGMDSCTAPKFLAYINKHPDMAFLKTYIEPCESLLFSIYVNCEGIVYPCSFAEKESGTKLGGGISLLTVEDFDKEVWNSHLVNAYRNEAFCKISKDGCNSCPFFNV